MLDQHEFGQLRALAGVMRASATTPMQSHLVAALEAFVDEHSSDRTSGRETCNGPDDASARIAALEAENARLRAELARALAAQPAPAAGRRAKSGAERQAEHRARKREVQAVAELAMDRSQLPLFGPPAPPESGVVRVTARDGESSLFVTRDVTRDAPSLSDLKIYKNQRESSVTRVTAVTLSRGDPLPDAARAVFHDVVARRDVDLDSGVVWRKFVNANAGKRFASEDALLGRWENWVESERPSGGGRARARDSPPPSQVRPRPRPELRLFGASPEAPACPPEEARSLAARLLGAVAGASSAAEAPS